MTRRVGQRKPGVCLALISAALLIVSGAVLLSPGCARSGGGTTEDGRVIVEYWEHWTGFEGEAMQAVVDDFNASQDRIFVRKLTVSQMEQKVVLATSGGNPPDVVGLWSYNVSTYAEKGALTPLNKWIEAAGITRDDYIPALWDLCEHRGFIWALPTTPATIALHWNRRLFKEAGLDPDQPPRSIEELDRMAEQLTIVEIERDGQTRRVRFTDLAPKEREAKDFSIIQLGFSPNEPGWWKQMWGYWFGADLWDGERTITANSAGNIAAMKWHGSYTRKYGTANVKKFGASFGNTFASPQNPFLDERIAMEIQGVWMYNLIDRYSPQLDWAVAAFPSADPQALPNVTIIDCDILAIPKGAKHPDEAFEFIRYVNTQGPMEKLCLGHRKFSPLAKYSDQFIARHPNPNIRVYIDLARGPNVRTTPQMSIWQEYNEELSVAADRVFGGVATPQEAMEYVQERVQWKFDRALRRWDLTGAERMRQWAEP
jgi:multiple sugar transport system substrate-binding protein